jgi:hypothetical protein
MKPKDFPTNCKFFPPDISLHSHITTLCLCEGTEESSIPQIIVLLQCKDKEMEHVGSAVQD